MMMRVCFVSQLAARLLACDPTDASLPMFGGAELQMVKLAKALAKLPGFDVHVVVQGSGARAVRKAGDLTVWEYARPADELRFARWTSVWGSAAETLRAVEAQAYVQSPASFLTYLTMRSARERGAAAYYWIASDADLGTTLLGHWLERVLFRRGLKNMDGILAQTEEQLKGARAFSARYRLKRTPLLLPNAFEVPKAPPAGTRAGALWVASSQELKRPYVFLDLAKEHPRFPFTMVMPKSDEALFREIAARAASLPNLTFVSYVAPGEIQALFDAACVFVNTSSVEGSPNTFVQAQIAATPIVSLDVDPDGIVEREGCGVCAHGDRHVFTAACLAYLTDDVRAKAAGEAGFASARDRHDVAKIVSTFADYLHSGATSLHSS